MIITASKALNLVSNHSILQAVPELLSAVESFAQKNREWQPKKGCGDCNKIDFFAPVEKEALAAFSSLNSDAVRRLKDFLKLKTIYVSATEPGKQAVLKELL